jgi:hypothetical protein
MKPFLLASIILVRFCALALGQNDSWLDDYEMAKGFRMDVDTSGYHLPTSIAFVPNPGSRPDSPLYFVTEIRGRVKVVTNDRSIHTFAEDFFHLVPKAELPDPSGGYVFVSYGYQDELDLYRNGISRFQSAPDTFGLKANSRIDLLPVLKNYLSTLAHQIGPMAIHDGLLYVSIGDGDDPMDSRVLESPKGKILRLTLDGAPAPGNPYKVDNDPTKIKNFVWASGLRNPFSLKIVDGHVFVGDNGPNQDRFIKIQAGDDFLYDGSNESVSTNALFIWKQAVSPMQMDYNPERAAKAGFPEPWKSSFHMALSGGPMEPPGRSQRNAKSIVAMGVDIENGKLTRRPETLLRFIGNVRQLPVGTAFGPDGLYMVPLLPDSQGNSPILRITYDPDNQHPHIINNLNPLEMVNRFGCMGCHKFDGEGYSIIGPEINRIDIGDKLLQRLNSPEYKAQSQVVDALPIEPFTKYAEARNKVLTTTGMGKVRTWLTYRLLEPRFDQEVIGMPNLGMTQQEAEVLTDWILKQSDSLSTTEKARQFINRHITIPSKKQTLISFMLGAIFGAVALSFYWKLRKQNTKLPAK